jgi:hypothetical protein
MDMMTLTELSAIPATLVVLGGLLVLYLGSPERANRRFLFYILGIASLTILATLLGSRYWKTPYHQSEFYLPSLLMPVFVGILALVVLHLGQLRGLRWPQNGLALLLLLVLICLGAVIRNSQYFYIYYLLGIALALAAVWAGGLRSSWLMGVFLLLALVCLIMGNDPLFSWLFSRANTQLPKSLRIAFAMLAYAFPVLVVALPAVLIHRTLKPAVQKNIIAADSDHPEAIQPSTPARQHGLAQILQLGMAAFLLGGLIYTIYWSSIWDHTSDGLGGIFLALYGAMTGVGAGMLMSIFSSGWRRLAGLLFLVLVPLLLFQAFNRGWRVSYHAITEERAATITTALERFHARTGAYPQVLGELTPRDLLILPQPVILRGESWCYQGISDSYRLGAAFREYFSSPLSIRIYASAGEPLASAWECDARLEELKAIYDVDFTEQQPTYVEQEARLPQSEVPVPRQALSPVVEGKNLHPGSWSPDGRYFTFARNTSLQFLDVTQSLVCSGYEQISLTDEPRASTAWLPDGRLLAIDPQGVLILQAPCGAAEPLSGIDVAIFQKIIAADPSSGNMLLKAGGDFWILDGASLALKHVEAVTPNPYELHWDQASWLPGGRRLAISRLNGRESSEGSTLYILDGWSGEVQLSLPRAFASEQSAPRVEWLAENQLLFDGGGVLVILGLSAHPPQETNVMQDLFGLDLAYPDEISAMASVIDRTGNGYYLAVRANHPRNQSLYLYTSATGQVQVFDHQNHSLLFFPDGQIVEMPKSENVPTYHDEFDLVWVGQPDSPEQHMAVTGHTPRSYPTLFMEPTPRGENLYFSSSQGVSLVTVPEGDMLVFWDLGGGDAYITGPENAAGNQRFVAVVDGVGFYIIPSFGDE